MTRIFLENYSLSGALTFEGVTEHYAAFSAEKEWNSHAIVHLTLAILDLFPFIYLIEGLFYSLVSDNPEEEIKKEPLPLKETPPKNPPPIKPEKVELKSGTVFGTKNQYTDAKNDEQRQSCTVQALTFLRAFFQNGSVDAPMIDRCLKEGLQIFVPLSQKLHEERRHQARDYLTKQGAQEDVVDQFLRENPGAPKEYPLMLFLAQFANIDTSIAAQLLSGHAVNAKEASAAFTDDLKEVSDVSTPLPNGEQERKALFERKLPEGKTGTVLTCNGVTILVAKAERHYVIYDSHSNTALHPDNPSAYVKTVETPQEAAAFLTNMFEYRVGSTNQVEMMTFAPQGLA